MATVTKQQLENSPNGIHAKFVDLGDCGMKIYRSDIARDAQFNNQTYLEGLGLAVKCWDCIDFDGPDGETLYAFYTEKAETYEGKDQARWIDCLDNVRSLLSDHGIEWEDDHLGNIGIDSDGDPVLIDCDFLSDEDGQLEYVGCGTVEEWE